MIRIEFLPTPAELMKPPSAPMPAHSIGADAGAVMAAGTMYPPSGAPAGEPLPSWVYPLAVVGVIGLILKWAYGAKPVERAEGQTADGTPIAGLGGTPKEHLQKLSERVRSMASARERIARQLNSGRFSCDEIFDDVLNLKYDVGLIYNEAQYADPENKTSAGGVAEKQASRARVETDRFATMCLLERPKFDDGDRHRSGSD